MLMNAYIRQYVKRNGLVRFNCLLNSPKDLGHNKIAEFCTRRAAERYLRRNGFDLVLRKAPSRNNVVEFGAEVCEPQSVNS